MRSGEDRLIAWLRRQGAVTARLGDDAAILEAGELAVTVDTQSEGVHFFPGLDPAKIASRLLAVNLSDLAAMGALPRFALLSLSAPAGFDHRRFFRSFLKDCRAHGLELIGGDLARTPHCHAVLTLFGASQGHWLRRSEAAVGQKLWVGGPLGLSGLGFALQARGCRLDKSRLVVPAGFELGKHERLARQAIERHLSPRPQLALGAWLAQQGSGAAIDVSDGLTRDLGRLCRESEVGAEVDAEALPAILGAEALARTLGRDFLDLALGGGEDYVLLFTLPNEVTPPRELGATAIGKIVKSGMWLRRHSRRERLVESGFDHLTSATA